jgi:hypothetical protein
MAGVSYGRLIRSSILTIRAGFESSKLPDTTASKERSGSAARRSHPLPAGCYVAPTYWIPAGSLPVIPQTDKLVNRILCWSPSQIYPGECLQEER